MSRVVSYFTPEYQATAVEYLLPSLIQANVPHTVREVPSLKSWQGNTQYKSQFLLRMHDEFRDEGLLWVDVDARVYWNPFEYLEAIDCDIAVHYLRGKELLSGTVWLPATKQRGKILASWHAENMLHPDRWDQKNLESSLTLGRHLKLSLLPPEYCFIFDTSKKLHPDTVPIIEHFQASRAVRKSKAMR
jgi:hypothetical protein